MQEQIDYLLTQVRSAWRFRWLALAAAWLIALGGWAVVAMMPDQYEASARLYVDTTSELRQILGEQIIEPDLESQLNFVRESMMGRAQLLHVVNSTGLRNRVERPGDAEALASALRDRIELIVVGDPRGRVRDNMYTIRFRDTERGVALGVVDAVVNAFMEDTLGRRREGSDRTRAFLEQQIEEVTEELAEIEQRRADFRREHAELLPGTEGGYVERLQAAVAQLDDTEQELAQAEARRARLQEQLAGERALSPAVTATGEPVPGSLEARIRDYEILVDDLLLRYQPRHHDVVAARETLERLRRQQEDQAAAQAGGAAVASDNPVYQQMRISLNEVEVDIASLTIDRDRRQARVDRLRSMVEEIPEIERQAAQLDRDYDAKTVQRQNLVRSLQTERLTREASETDQIGFQLIDPPTAPPEPASPPRALMIFFVLMAGFGGGGGVAFLLSQVKPVFTDPRTLRELTGLPVAGIVSRTWKARHRMRRRAEVVSFMVGCAALVGVCAAVFVFEILGGGLRGLMA